MVWYPEELGLTEAIWSDFICRPWIWKERNESQMKIKRKERTLGRFAGAGRRLQSVPKDSVVGCVKPVQREPGISWGWREAGCLCGDFFLIFTSDT